MPTLLKLTVTPTESMQPDIAPVIGIYLVSPETQEVIVPAWKESTPTVGSRASTPSLEPVLKTEPRKLT